MPQGERIESDSCFRLRVAVAGEEILHPDCRNGLSAASKRPVIRAQACNMYIQRHRRREIVRMSLTPLPHLEGLASHIAAMQMMDGPETLEQLEQTTGRHELQQRSALQCLKSLDDLDEEEADDDDTDPDDEEDEDDLEEDYDEDEDEDDENEGDEDEDEDDEDEDEEDDVKPLKMSSPRSESSRL